MTHQAGTARHGHEVALETDQATRRNAVFETHTAFAVRLHVLQIATTTTEFFHQCALVGFFHVHGQHFVWLAFHAVDLFEYHAWTRYAQLEAFATHVFNQNGQVQFAATGHFKHGVVVGVFHTQSDVVFQFFFQTVANLTAGDELAFAPCQRRGVHHKIHGQGRLIHRQHWQCFRRIRRTYGRTDVQIFDPVDQHDVACFGFGHQYAIQALEFLHLVDLAGVDFTLGAVHKHHALSSFDTTTRNTANGDFTDIAGVVQRGHLHLER